MARRFERKRHRLPDATIAVLRPVLRYSPSRDAYVLRGVGNLTGPVVRRKSATGRFTRGADHLGDVPPAPTASRAPTARRFS